MDTRQMRCVVAIADSGSLTRAAEILGLAQPALTQTVNRLEAEIGTRLFVRSRRGATLTDAGHAIIDDVRASLAYGDVALARARSIGTGTGGELTISFVSHALYEVLPRALRGFRALYPEVKFRLREMNNAEQVEALERGHIDVALLHPPVSVNAKVHELKLGAEGMVAALPSAFKLADDGRVSLAELAQHGLVWFPENQVSGLRNEMLSAIRSAGHHVSVTQEANRTLTVLAAVAAGLGWSLLPQSVRALHHDGVRYAEVRDGDGLPSYELAAMWRVRSRPGFADSFAALLDKRGT
ncbi:LysR family transcriptional regulator [Variovorax sp. PAMC 28711]|uniref:LysR family transcriptional regulator n=1 Tax=Variovorax sp. PAMC 28711 TaxID=1795631 RepID=UPI00078CAD1B|nr:LysR family transcriptional regulator [Variovorax sp. PAMC 28711]AMM23433.1 LysR family transcriptional regulator [Variovorax sp. PAMC 28711]